MKIYRHWAKASQEISIDDHPWTVERYGASNESPAAAQVDAQQRAKRTAEIFLRGEFPNSYLYADRPLREEIIQTFGNEDEPDAVITRNAYGCLVLNTARVFFADVDDPAKKQGSNPLKPLVKLLGGWFGASNVAEDILDEGSNSVPKRMEKLVAASPGLGLRVYRTAAGYRCLVTSREYQPLADDTQQLLSDMGSDPLYVKLCQLQECFRARLTPKFWRCGADCPPARFPWSDSTVEQSMREWEANYQEQSAGYATCELVDEFGYREVLPQIAAFVKLHDQLSCKQDCPLA